MKVAAILHTKVKVGGGFNQGLNAILQMQKICDGNFDFSVYTNLSQNIDYLSDLGIKAKLFKKSILDKWLYLTTATKLGRSIQNKLRRVSSLENMLLKDNVDLVYFVSPGDSCLLLQRINYITTVWDLCHRVISMAQIP